MGSRQRIRIDDVAIELAPHPKRSTKLSIIDAVADPRLFGPWFERSRTWDTWIVFLRTVFGLDMSAEQAATFHKHTNRQRPPSTAATEAWVICGRRSGKSFILALIATFLATCRDYRQYLAPGERATIMIIASDRKQSRVILRFVRAFLTHIPMFASLIERETAEGFDLKGQVTIEIATCSFRSIRGYSIAAALGDEVAFWSSDDNASSPDSEILAALRPAMALIPGAVLLMASSPYSRRGVLWNAYRKHFGQDNEHVLVWQADSRSMNPTVPQEVIDTAYADDPAAAAAEYSAVFRTDLESFVSREAVEACISYGVRERAPVAGIRYVGFCDPSGGSVDSMTIAVAHRENGVAVLDAVRERKAPFSPDDVVQEFAKLLKSYGLNACFGDRYAGQWPVERFRLAGISYQSASKPRSALYGDLLPLINSQKVDLLDHPKMIAQFVSLERRTGRTSDAIDHPPGQHDDVANSCAGALVSVGARKYKYDSTMRWAVGDQEPNDFHGARMRAAMLGGRLL
jgi:hypothetical protein